MSKKTIVTTTIYPPGEAIHKFSKFSDWELIVVGDLKTPHDLYEKIDCTYLHPKYQELNYPKLSECLGWNTIQRRNIGFVEAIRRGAEIIATVDDDNIPYQNWGKHLLVNQEVEVDVFTTENEVFDPLSVTSHKDLWHRGFPISMVHKKNDIVYEGKEKRKVLVQADLWDGDPDIDAVCRITKKPIVKFQINSPFSSKTISPFNSQNTFLSSVVMPYYMVLPFVGRMDDIWGSYILQKKFKNSVIYNKASVYQKRNEQDLVVNLENELIGYKNTLNFIRGDYSLPENSMTAYKIYQETISKYV